MAESPSGATVTVEGTLVNCETVSVNVTLVTVLVLIRSSNAIIGLKFSDTGLFVGGSGWNVNELGLGRTTEGRTLSMADCVCKLLVNGSTIVLPTTSPTLLIETFTVATSGKGLSGMKVMV